MEKNRIAQEIESVFAKLQHGEKSYSKGEFYKEYFFIRSDLALVILNKKNEILISFADHTPPSNAALYSLLLDDIESTSLCICKDYKTDGKGSMIMNEGDLSNTSEVIWDDKERYYKMLKSKVRKIIARRTK